MAEHEFDWHDRYFIPAGVRFRATPAGALQVDGEGADRSVEVPREWVERYLGFARPQVAEAALVGTGGRAEGERASVRERLEQWRERGLLRRGEAAPPPSRLSLFAAAAAEFFSSGARRFPLRSQFALQRPVVFYPGLETREIHDREQFAWLAALEDAFPVIQREFLALLQGGPGFATVHRGHTSEGEWAAAYLWAFGKQVEETCRACPETVRVLSAIPGVAQFGTTLYSALAPHTQIAPHHGFTNAKLRCQLPLRVPEGCRLKVGDQEVAQQEGRCIVFDDSFLHAAWNDSAEARFVLVFDFFHPDLTAAEIAYLSLLAERRQLGQGYLKDAAAGETVGWARPASRGDEEPARGEAGRAARGRGAAAGKPRAPSSRGGPAPAEDPGER